MTKLVNGFGSGMDRDSSKNKYDNQHYYDAKNFRIVTQEGLSGGALENIRGTQYRLNIDPDIDGSEICGHTVLGEYLIIWTTTNTGTPNGTSTDRVWKVPISSLEALTGVSVLVLDTDYFWDGGNLIYEENMWLSTQNVIKAIPRYENDDIQKVYWVDGYNRLRHLNVVHNADTNDLTTMSLDKLEVISDIELTTPTVVDIPGGNLRAGRIQYAYQLYMVNGSETVFSPATGLINLTGYSDTSSTSENYRGSEIDDNTGKAVKGSIEITSTGYTRIRLVAIHYTSLSGDPEIRIFDERKISGAVETVYFTDTGESRGSYVLEEFRTLGSILFTAEEIETKDNILFPANIVEESFDVDYDARAYRFAGISATNTDPNFNEVAALRGMSQVYQEDGTYYEITGLDKSTVYEPYGTPVSGGWANIPDNADCINNFNNIANDGFHDHRFMYQSDGIVPGGEGPNVSYEFQLKEIIIDDFTVVDQRLFTSLEGTSDNPSYHGYASPYNSEKYVGYHRDEIYRFGVVFFDGKGRSSFVKWIGDIRFPSISTISNENKYNLGGGSGATPQIGDVTVNNMGNQVYTIQITDSSSVIHTFSWDNTVAGLDYITVANILRNQIITSPVASDATIGPNVSGTFTITWDKVYGSYAVNDYGGTFVNYTETQSYAPGTGASNDHTIAWYDGTVIRANVLYPEFTINNIPAGIESYQIVRVKREGVDRTVMAQGIVGGTTTTTGGIEALNWTDSSGYLDTYTFASPEVAFNRDLTRQSNDRLQEVGEFSTNVQVASSAGLFTFKYSAVAAMTNPQRPEDESGAGSAAGDEHDITSKTNIVDGKIIAQDQVEGNVGNDTFFVNNAGNSTDKGISFVFEATNTTWRSKDKSYNASGDDGRMLINYRRNVFNTQYGGLSFNNRKQNNYQPASNVIDSGTSLVATFGGDTYIGMFDYLYSSWEHEALTSSEPEVIYFPVETSINLTVRLDDCYHRAYGGANAHLIHETAGIWADDTNEYSQPTDLYRYNTVYSKENDSKIFIQTPFDWNSETDFPVRTYASEKKITNEYSDSWLNFKANSYIDVDPQFGEITKLIAVNERMLFFQPKAFGVLSINERALLQTGDISQLSLGTSGVLERFDYAKRDVGASNKRHVLLTPNALYWIDTINKSMYRYTGGPEEVSLMKGMDSYFRFSLINGTSTFLFHDPEFKEVYINDYVDNWSLAYNELTEGFTGFVDYYPSYVVNYLDKVLGTRSGDTLYKHNDTYANRGQLYGVYQDSYVTLLINPHGETTAIYNNFEWFTELIDPSGDEVDSTYTNIRLWNDYQGMPLVGDALAPDDNVKRRMRKWRYTIPRASSEPDGVTTKDVRDARFRDTHLFAKFTYANDANDRRLVGHDIITSVTISNK